MLELEFLSLDSDFQEPGVQEISSVGRGRRTGGRGGGRDQRREGAGQ
jgi:hypothetical protein